MYYVQLYIRVTHLSTLLEFTMSRSPRTVTPTVSYPVSSCIPVRRVDLSAEWLASFACRETLLVELEGGLAACRAGQEIGVFCFCFLPLLGKLPETNLREGVTKVHVTVIVNKTVSVRRGSNEGLATLASGQLRVEEAIRLVKKMGQKGHNVHHHRHLHHCRVILQKRKGYIDLANNESISGEGTWRAHGRVLWIMTTTNTSAQPMIEHRTMIAPPRTLLSGCCVAEGAEISPHHDSTG